MLRDLLNARGRRDRPPACRTLMRRMGIEAIYRRPEHPKPAPGHKIYPYLLRSMTIAAEPGLGDGHHVHPDGGAASSIWWRSWTGSAAGFCAWRLSITMEASSASRR